MEDHIKIDLRQINEKTWYGFIWLRITSTTMNLRYPWQTKNLLASLATLIYQGLYLPTHLPTYPPTYLPITYLPAYLSIYGSTALVDLDRFFSFLICTHSVGLLGRGISPSQGRYLHTEQHKHRINSHRYPCLEWDSNPRSQCLRERRATTVTGIKDSA
jgi:hypothetical protein